MGDARSIEFADELRRGVGTRMRVLTVFGPLHTTDVMEVISWEEGQSIGVRHVGLVTGEGTLGVAPDEEGSVVTWDETLVFPWWLGGPIAGSLASPLLARVWQRNLKQLERYLSFL